MQQSCRYKQNSQKQHKLSQDSVPPRTGHYTHKEHGDKVRDGGIPGADIRYVGLATHEYLGTAKVAQLQLMRLRVDQQVLGLDVPMTHLHAVDVRQRPAHLHRQASKAAHSSAQEFSPHGRAPL